MASVHSLGLHEPSALSYLVAEGILPPDPPATLYKWQAYCMTSDCGEAPVEEEVLSTEYCTVWSRSGVIQRVFNLNVEVEPVLHAFPTWFNPTKLSHGTNKTGWLKNKGSRERGLAVFLRSQAHIFLLSGDTYVLPLSFEVDRAYPCSHGLILQRKLEEEELNRQHVKGNPDITVAGNNGFAGPRANTPNPLLVIPDTQATATIPKPSFLPRTFSFTELLSELGLVVCTSSRKVHTLDGCQSLPAGEELVYVSADDELQGGYGSPVCLALTLNLVSSTFTLWQVVTKETVGSSARVRSRKQDRSHHPSRRKSSNVYGRLNGAATPVSRAQAPFRESFGGLARSHAENLLNSSIIEQRSLLPDDLATQLGQDFGEVGVQTRSARRVSSMLARTDLGAGNDRGAFNELALGQAGRKSMARSVRRGESMGSFSERQSFGPRRGSFNANLSVLSTGTSYLDVPGRTHFDELESLHPLEEGHDGRRDEATSNLPREIGFVLVKSFGSKQMGSESFQTASLKVFAIVSPEQASNNWRYVRKLDVCILDKLRQEMAIVHVSIEALPLASHSQQNEYATEVKVHEVRRGKGIVDACKVVDGDAHRLLMLTQPQHGCSTLSLEASWSTPFRLELPEKLQVFSPFTSFQFDSPGRRRETGLNRLIRKIQKDVTSFSGSNQGNKLILSDPDLHSHQLRLCLKPRDPTVLRIITMTNLVLPVAQQDTILVAWWEVMRWIKNKDFKSNQEWVALVVVLFNLAVPFMEKSRTSATPRRKKGGLMRSSSGATHDTANWQAMTEEVDPSRSWNQCSAWLQRNNQQSLQASRKSQPKHNRSRSSVLAEDRAALSQDDFVVQCINLASEYHQTPAGEAANGPEGYLPTAVSRGRQSRKSALASIVVGMHLLCEEQKLDNLAFSAIAQSVHGISIILAQLGRWLGWDSWTWKEGGYYRADIIDVSRCLFDDSEIETLEMPDQPFDPPSIFHHIENCIHVATAAHFPTLLDIVGESGNNHLEHPYWQAAARLTPRTFTILAFLKGIGQSPSLESTLKSISICGIDRKTLSTMPGGVAAAMHFAISTGRNRPSSVLSVQLHNLLDRDDLSAKSRSGQEIYQPRHAHPTPSHSASKDYRSISASALDTEGLQRWDASSEMDRQTITRLIFNEDRRFQEASKLVNQTRPPVVECNPEPEWSEADLLEAQKELAQHVTRRTLSVASGRGMMHFDARVPLLTERVPVSAFSLQCVMMPRHDSDNVQPMTFSADKAAFTEDKVCWAFFHNGASTALMMSKKAKCIDTSWILYNKPAELTNRHAGFLLALGLNGHLRTLAKWVAFKYLTPKHTMTSIGLLLGLATSYLSTMDTSITRLLSVHVTRLLPPGAAELNLSPLTQTTGIMGIGLLYYNSQHRRMSEVMLSEIENNDSEEGAAEDAVLRNEGYRLAAGFSLGLINLGQGKDLHGLHDMSVVERLLSVAIGTKNINLVHVLDRATAGAVIAIALLFLKTNDQALARKIDIPDTMHQFDYVRPDIFLLRTLARHLILWDSIQATQSFVRNSLPLTYQQRSDLNNTKSLSTEDLPFFNILAGICFAIGLRYAGSQDEQAKNLLVAYLDQFLRLSRLSAMNYDAKVAMNSVRHCLNIIALATASVMAGSGDLVVLRRLRALHGRTDKDTPFGSHLAAHMALGSLFLAGGTATFGTSNLAVAALVIAFYPLFPGDVLDNRAHLQALRHLWVLAVEHRCLVARNIEDRTLVGGIDASIKLKDGSTKVITIPGLLPSLDSIETISIVAEGYWNVAVDMTDASSAEQYIKDQGVNVYMQRRATYDNPNMDVFRAELQAIDGASGVPSVNPNARSTLAYRAGQHGDPFEWLFQLDALNNLDHSESDLTLNSTTTNTLKDTVIDTRLEFEKGILNDEEGGPQAQMSSNKLWQLRLLFAWADKWDEANSGEEEETWLRKEVIEKLRWRVWNMATGNIADE